MLNIFIILSGRLCISIVFCTVIKIKLDYYYVRYKHCFNIPKRYNRQSISAFFNWLFLKGLYNFIVFIPLLGFKITVSRHKRYEPFRVL